MKSVAKKQRTNKKPVEKPVSEGIQRAAERAGIAPLARIALLAEELRWMHADLGEVIEHVIGTRMDGEFERENFEDALVKLRSVRICLDYEINKLDPKPAVAS